MTIRKMKQADEIRIHRKWLRNSQSSTLPDRYVENPFRHNLSNNRKLRFKDLVRLLKIFYKIEQKYYQFLLNEDGDISTFQKYIVKEVIANYPFKCFNHHLYSIPLSRAGDQNWQNWIKSLYKSAQSPKLSKQPLIKIISTMSFLERKKIRESRLKCLAEVLNCIYQLFHKRLVITNINGRKHYNHPIYGDRLPMLAYVGQHIIRFFPFKDVPYWSKSAFASSTGRKIVPEHWTPITFFRDILILDLPPNVKMNTRLWFKILKKYYRVVYITENEDSRLNSTKGPHGVSYKTKRPASAYKNLIIRINNHNDFERFHS
jgi:hypothetical protein